MRAKNFAHATLADALLNPVGAESRTGNGFAGATLRQQRLNFTAQSRIGSASDREKCIAFNGRKLARGMEDTLNAPPAFGIDGFLGGRCSRIIANGATFVARARTCRHIGSCRPGSGGSGTFGSPTRQLIQLCRR
jgi:hypothetical protein